MRLEHFEIEKIKSSALKIFGKDAHVYLFGSRVDDFSRGGDIDLYIQSPTKSSDVESKINFLIELKSAIGDQKIDVIMAKDLSRLIEQEALQKGIRLL
jgi:predicted nucleotidyltransferase